MALNNQDRRQIAIERIRNVTAATSKAIRAIEAAFEPSDHRDRIANALKVVVAEVTATEQYTVELDVDVTLCEICEICETESPNRVKVRLERRDMIAEFDGATYRRRLLHGASAAEAAATASILIELAGLTADDMRVISVGDGWSVAPINLRVADGAPVFSKAA